MSVITFVCAVQMNSAITFPAFENGHEVRLVGSPLDRDIIDGLRKDNFHITLKRTLHDGIKYYQIEELQEALEGADLLIVSTNWEDPYEEDWDLITKARAFDNTLHLVAANRIGDDGGTLSFFGHSKIISPTGKEIAALDERVEGVISAEIDLSLTQKERARYYTFFKDRRPEAYGDIVKMY